MLDLPPIERPIFLYERSTPTVIWFLNIHVSDPTAKKKTSKQYKIRIKYDKKKNKRSRMLRIQKFE